MVHSGSPISFDNEIICVFFLCDKAEEAVGLPVAICIVHALQAIMRYV